MASPPGHAAESDKTVELEKQRDSVRSWLGLALVAALIAGCVAVMVLPVPVEVVGIAGCVLMLVLTLLRMPIAFAMTIPGLLGMWAMRGEILVGSSLATVPYTVTASWTLSVIPMFVLMGFLLSKAGLTESVYAAARLWLSWLPGGLAVGTNLSGAGLAAVSGSTIGTTYALARIGIPEMLKAGYDKRLAIGAVITAGLPGQLIPPSLLLVIYAGIADVPVGPQLLAGIGPGVLVAIMFTVMIIGFAAFKPSWGASTRIFRDELASDVTWRARVTSLAAIWPVPAVIGVIVWGMFSGTFTATEAGAAAAALSLIIAVIWKRNDRPVRAVADAVIATISSVGSIFLMLIGVEILARMLLLTGITTVFADFVTSMDLGRTEFLLMMLVVYLVMGTFLEPLSMLVLTIPILMPTLVQLDISLLWFGVFAVFMGELAVVSPPVGILAFVVYSIVKEPEVNGGQRITLGDVFMAVLWLLPMAIIVSLLLIFFPELATWIPDHMRG